jgi:hypothetical protein
MNSKSGKRLKNLCFRWKNAATTTPKIDGGAKKKNKMQLIKG